MHEEGDEGVGDVSGSELEMVSFNLDELDLFGLVESLETDGVAVVPVRFVKRLDLHGLVESLEPLRLFRVNHGVLIKHHGHKSVDG